MLINIINRYSLVMNNNVKWYLAVNVSFKKLINEDNDNCTSVFHLRTQLKLASNDIDELYLNCLDAKEAGRLRNTSIY